MEIEIRFNGRKLEFDENTTDQAMFHFMELYRLSNNSSNPTNNSNAIQIDPIAFPSTKNSKDDLDPIVRTIRNVKGLPAALILNVLLNHDDGCNDQELKSELPDDLRFAPAMAHLSKVCKKEGITKETIIERQETRRRKKLFYHYKLTHEARKVINEIGDITKEDEYPIF